MKTLPLQLIDERIQALERELLGIAPRLEELRTLRAMIAGGCQSAAEPHQPSVPGAAEPHKSEKAKARSGPCPKFLPPKPTPEELVDRQRRVLRVLRVLADGPLTGSAIARRTDPPLNEAAVCRLLRTRLDRGWWEQIESTNRLSPWRITAAGRQRLAELDGRTPPSPT